MLTTQQIQKIGGQLRAIDRQLGCMFNSRDVQSPKLSKGQQDQLYKLRDKLADLGLQLIGHNIPDLNHQQTQQVKEVVG